MADMAAGGSIRGVEPDRGLLMAAGSVAVRSAMSTMAHLEGMSDEMNHALWIPWQAPEPRHGHDHEFKSDDISVTNWDTNTNYPWGGVSWRQYAWRSDPQ